MFNGKRLALARRRRRLSAKALADLSGLSAITIARLEKGGRRNCSPDESTVDQISKALRFPGSFFFGDDPEEISISTVSFRSLSKMSVRDREAGISAAEIALALNDWVEARFDLPQSKVPDFSQETNPEAASRRLRDHWLIGERPIGHMLALLEAHGVRIFSLAEETASLDAFSFWKGQTPFIFLNSYKTPERSIFDAAHELGHLVMHRHSGPNDQSRENEREADAFASAFLMPESDVCSRVPRFVTVDVVLKAKHRWRVSAMAMAKRLHTLNVVSDWQYKNLCIELGKKGYRSSEPIGIERERSLIWQKILVQLWSERLTKNDIAMDLSISLEELENLIWGLAGETPKRESRTIKIPSQLKEV